LRAGGEDTSGQGLTRFSTSMTATSRRLLSDCGRRSADLAVARAPAMPRGCRRSPREDLDLLEINPLALTADGRSFACDARVIRDDSATDRHDR
jgi:succinyl-CoA synthetase beta subunit